METLESAALKNVALVNKHESLNAKMVPFAGYMMPVSYSGLKDEHITVRNAVGVFDVRQSKASKTQHSTAHKNAAQLSSAQLSTAHDMK